MSDQGAMDRYLELSRRVHISNDELQELNALILLLPEYARIHAEMADIIEQDILQDLARRGKDQ